MSNEEETRRVEEALDDLLLSVETLAYVVINCTMLLISAVLINVHDSITIILGLMTGMLALVTLFVNLKVYKGIAKLINVRKISRR